MTTQYTPILKLALPVQGELSGTWGDVVNDNITSMVEQAIAGLSVVNTWTTNSHTLTTANGTTAESRAAMLSLTDSGTALTGAGSVICPALSKVYIVKNGTAEIITVKTAAGSGIAVPVGKTMLVYCDGTNVLEAVDHVVTLSAGTLTITGLTTFASLKGTGATTVTNILDEDNMASDSATAIATQQSIKAYVDSQVGTVDTLSEILANGNTTGANDIDVDAAQKVQFRDAAIYINSSVDGQLDIVADTEIQIAATTIDINGAVDVSGTALVTGVLTTTAATVFNGGFASNADSTLGTDKKVQFRDAAIYINSSVDGQLDIVADTEIQIAATTVDLNGNLDVSGTALITGVLTTTGEITANGGIALGDNDKATFGSSDDLQIYHNANQSFIEDAGTGDLYIRAADNLRIQSYGDNEDMIKAVKDGAVTLYHNNATKLATTATGIDISGTVTATGTSVFASLDISGDIDVDGTTNLDVVDIDGAVDMASTLAVGGVVTANAGVVVDNFTLDGTTLALSSGDLTLDVAGDIILDADGGDIFFKDGGTTISTWQNSSSDVVLKSNVQDKDIKFQGNDGGSLVTALTLDMSEAGAATFNSSITIPDYIYHTSDANTYFGFPGGDEFELITAAQSRMKLVGSETTFNESSNDTDFRVESDANTHMLFVDAGNDQVIIGSSSSLNPSDAGLYARDGLIVGNFSGSGNGLTVYRGSGLNTNINHDSTKAFLTTSEISLHFRTTLDTNYKISMETDGVVINEGGVDYDFRVESDTNTHALFVQGSNSFVGINTAVPGVELDITRITNSYPLRIGSTSGSGRAMVFADISGAPAKRNWVMGAQYNTDDGWELTPSTAAGGYTFTNRVLTAYGSTGDLVVNENGVDADFRVESDTNANMLFVDASTDTVNIGGTAAGANVISMDAGRIRLNKSSDWNIESDGGTAHIRFLQSGVENGSITTDGTNTTYATSSDYRLKENIVDAPSASDDIDAIQVRSFDWKANGSHQVYGLIAQELLPILPNAVAQGEKEEDMMGVDYSKLVPMLIKEIQSLRARVADLES
jgi:hypothetical protein